MTAAGFSGGEAEELRRAMGFKRSVERMGAIEQRLRSGMTARGITGANQDQIVQSITSFALYGFPESHAASFALIAYASAYLKCYHPTAFLISLLNAWPMGFYHPASLVKDAQRHGVRVLPVDVHTSDWPCVWEDAGPDPATAAPGACRIGLRYVSGLRRETGERIVAARRAGPFRDVEDLKQRAALRGVEMARLSEVGALASLGLSRREALWQAALAVRPKGELFEDRQESVGDPPCPAAPASPLPEMSAYEETVADFAGTSLTVGAHPVTYARAALTRQGVVTAAEVPGMPAGTRTRIAGAVIVRQRPGTANGTLFITLEDETGMVQAIVKRALLLAHRTTIVGNPGLVIEGVVQQRDGSVSLQAEKFWPLAELVETPSHDFH